MSLLDDAKKLSRSFPGELFAILEDHEKRLAAIEANVTSDALAEAAKMAAEARAIEAIIESETAATRVHPADETEPPPPTDPGPPTGA